MCAFKEMLSKEECESVLHNYLEIKEVNLTSYTIESLSDTIDGMIGEHYIVKMRFRTGQTESNHRFFLKVLNGNINVMFELAKSLNAYEKEEFFYNYLQKEYLKAGIDVSYSPKGFLCKPYKIVMEDLSLKHYKMREKKLFFDLDHCKIALETLAKFHCSHIIYEKKKSICLQEQFPQHLDDKVFSNKPNPASKWLKCSIQGLTKIIDHLNLTQKQKETFKVNLQEIYKQVINQQIKKTNLNTILHGDLWTNNFLFIYDQDKPIKGSLIDYQILKYGPPTQDVIQMIQTNTRKTLRDQHYTLFLNHYYECVVRLLNEGQLNADEIFSREEFAESCKDVEAGARLHALVDRSITFLSDEVLGDSFGSEESLERFLFEDRSKCIIDSFLTNELFREIIEEDMLEFMGVLSN